MGLCGSSASTASDPVERAFDAATDGNLKQLQALIADGSVSVNATFKRPRERAVTLMYCAAANNRLEIVRYLITAGFDCSTPSDEALDRTPLGSAIVFGRAPIVEALLAAGTPIKGAQIDAICANQQIPASTRAVLQTQGC